MLLLYLALFLSFLTARPFFASEHLLFCYPYHVSICFAFWFSHLGLWMPCWSKIPPFSVSSCVRSPLQTDLQPLFFWFAWRFDHLSCLVSRDCWWTHCMYHLSCLSSGDCWRAHCMNLNIRNGLPESLTIYLASFQGIVDEFTACILTSEMACLKVWPFILPVFRGLQVSWPHVSYNIRNGLPEGLTIYLACFQGIAGELTTCILRSEMAASWCYRAVSGMSQSCQWWG